MTELFISNQNDFSPIIEDTSAKFSSMIEVLSPNVKNLHLESPKTKYDINFSFKKATITVESGKQM